MLPAEKRLYERALRDVYIDFLGLLVITYRIKTSMDELVFETSFIKPSANVINNTMVMQQ